MPFDPPDLDIDEDSVTNRLLTGLASRLPGWEAYEGAVEVAMLEETGRETAVLNQSLVDVTDYAIAALGETAFGFPAYPGAAATIAVDIDFNAAGTMIGAGFVVAGLNANGDEVAFELVEDLGVTGTLISTTLVATDVGDFANGVTGDEATGQLTIITATSNVVDVRATAASTGGADAELIEDYVERLADHLGTLRPGGVTARDLAALARTVPGVHRALAVDLYDPADPGVESERTATVFAVDDTSHPVTGPVATQLQAVLEAAREVNFIFHVEDPTYTTVAIAYEVLAKTTADPVLTKTEIDIALTGLLTSWGSGAVSGGDDQVWTESTTLRIIDVLRAIGDVAGVADVTTLTLNGGTGDLALAGPAALPTPLDADTDPSTITGTVS